MATDTLEIFGTEYTGVTGIKATDDQSGTKVYIRPQGTKSISANGTGIDVAEYASVDVSVPSGQPNLQSKTHNVSSAGTATVTADSGYDGLSSVSVSVPSADWGLATEIVTKEDGNYIYERSYPNFSAGYYSEGEPFTFGLDLENKSVTPSLSQQTITPTDNYCYLNSVTVAAMPSGTAGTPTATKGSVSNHQVSVTPSVTNTSGYITGSTKTGTAVTVSASELVSGSETKTANGTYDVTNLAQLVVNVASGSSKNTQIVQSTTRTNASALTAIGAELTVSKTGTYDIYYSCFRTNTSSSYTWATRLYINGTAYGTAENTTWTNNQQNTHLSNISLTANDKLRVYGRNTRGTSYYVCAPMLVIVEA